LPTPRATTRRPRRLPGRGRSPGRWPAPARRFSRTTCLGPTP